MSMTRKSEECDRGRTGLGDRERFAMRSGAVTTSLAALLTRSACGGGGDSGVTFEVGVVVAGQPVGGAVQSGGDQAHGNIHV